MALVCTLYYVHLYPIYLLANVDLFVFLFNLGRVGNRACFRHRKLGITQNLTNRVVHGSYNFYVIKLI